MYPLLDSLRRKIHALLGSLLLAVIRAFIAIIRRPTPATTSAGQEKQEESGRHGAGSPSPRTRADPPCPEEGVNDHAIIVGAGPSGLAMAVSLDKKGVPVVLLERQGQVAWTNHMATRSMDDGLNRGYLPIPERFHTERQYIKHLQAYAAEYGIKPEFDAPVTSASYDKEAGLWRVQVACQTGRSSVEYAGRWLVVATGLEKDKCVISQIPGLLDFSGEVIHSSDYKPGGCGSYYCRDSKVLVLGGGKAGMEVIRDLCARGALPIMVTDDIPEMVAHCKSSSCYPVRWFIQTSHALLHFILAGIVLLLSWTGILRVSPLALMKSHGCKLVHAKSILELAGLLMCLSLCPMEKTMTFLVSTGILLSGVLVNLGIWCREGVSPTAAHKLVGTLIWSLLSLLEKVIVLLSWFVHRALFVLVVLMSFLDDLGIIGRWDVAPLALKNSRLHTKSTSFELIRLLMWYLLCLVEKIIAILLAVLGIESPDAHHESGIDLVLYSRIFFVPGITRFSETHVELTDGHALEIDAVILTAGYRSNVPQAQWPLGVDVNSNTRYPNTAFPGGWKGQSGLYAVGFDRRGSSAASGDPLLIADEICRCSKRKMPSTTSPGPPSNACIKVVF